MAEKIKLRQNVLIDGKFIPFATVMEKADLPPRLRTRDVMAAPDEDLGPFERLASEDEIIADEVIFSDPADMR